MDTLVSPLGNLSDSNNISISAATALKKESAIEFLDHLVPSRAFSPIEQTANLSCGCAVLDSLLSPCVYPGSILELSGLAGAGKTQLAYQLLVCNVSDTTSALYIKTEGDLSMERIQHIGSFKGSESFLDHIFIYECSSLSELEQLMTTQLEDIVCNNNVRLLVLDSIAGLSRLSGENDRFSLFYTITSLLKKLSFKYKMHVVIINQVTETNPFNDDSKVILPALGMSWGYLVNNRLMLFREHSVSLQGNSLKSNKRGILFGSLGKFEFNYEIKNSGFEAMFV
ncbi:hypothetical protein P9112_004280 [Eukaryota sp. TZLM1-RC]